MNLTGYNAREPSAARAFDLTGSVPFHEIKGTDGSFRLNQSALRHLDLVVREGLEDFGIHHPMEVGGILLGAIDAEQSLVTLVDVMPVQSEYLYGDAFRPSPGDSLAFSKAINRHSRGETRVIGYFRSNVGDSLSLRAEDTNLLSAFFTWGGCSIILVHTFPDQPNTAFFCDWAGGNHDVRIAARLKLVAAPAADDSLTARQQA